MNPYVFPLLKGVKLNRSKENFDVDKTIAFVCDRFGVTIEQVKSRTRIGKVSEARHIIIYFLMEETAMTCTAVGELFGRDHTSMLYARDKIRGYCKVSAEYRFFLQELKFGLIPTIGNASFHQQAS